MHAPMPHNSDIAEFLTTRRASSADDGLTVAIFTAEPGSASQQALDLLASWTATPSAAANAKR
jgi:hypothetical protein